MIRAFVDPNVFFSAAYRETNGILRLWQLADTQLVTSCYAHAEAQRNIALKRPQAIERFYSLASKLELSAATRALPDDYQLPDKDLPILETAIASGCSVLLTGDLAHFGHLTGETVEGVEILTVSMFLTGIHYDRPTR